MNDRPAFNRQKFLIGAALLLLSGCTGLDVAVNRKADFSHIQRVAVATFSGPGGDAAADMLAQDLLAGGADVVERQRLDAVMQEQRLAAEGALDPATVKKVGLILGVDAIFVGTVLTATPSQSYLVNSGGPGSINVNTVTPVNSSVLTSRGPSWDVPGSQVVTSAANVALIGRLVDVETGSILWSARMTYEGLDIQTAMSDVTSSFAHSLIPLWPALRPTKDK